MRANSTVALASKNALSRFPFTSQIKVRYRVAWVMCGYSLIFNSGIRNCSQQMNFMAYNIIIKQLHNYCAKFPKFLFKVNKTESNNN